MDTSTYSTTDQINIIYETRPGTVGPTGSNEPMERGGMLEAHYILLAQILTELRVQNEILLEGLMGRQGVSPNSVDDYRNEQTNPATLYENSGVGS